MRKTLSVAAIQNGTVIDHIPAGQALKIIALLRINQQDAQLTLGLNLPSASRRAKDILKLEGRYLTPQEANEITIFAPNATINIIKNFKVMEKITTTMPGFIDEVLQCPNMRCITRVEPIKTYFYVEKHRDNVHLQCKYCERTFARKELGVL